MYYKLLIVDDEEVFVKRLAKSLRRESYEVLVAGCAEEALKVLAENPVDVMLTDIRMPGMDGLELTNEVRKRYENTFVVVMTGHGDIKTAVDAIKAGASDFIQKPLCIDGVKSTIASAIESLNSKKAQEELVIEEESDNLFSDVDTVKIDVLARSIGNYELIEQIGVGGHGRVYKAKRKGTNTIYAMKIIRNEFTDTKKREKMVKRFLHEGNAISQMKHPNVIKFIELGYRDHSCKVDPYIVMEYFEAKPLTYYLNNPSEFKLEMRISLIAQVAGALSAVHSRGIIHRDIKPENILVNSDGLVKVTDFGVCHLPGSDLTLENETVGTPAFLSPEYIINGTFTHQSDIYALGVIAYEMFLGIRPYNASSFGVLINKIINEFPIEPRKINPDFPEGLQEIIGKMLKKKPSQRYSDAGEIVELITNLDGITLQTGIFNKIKASLFEDKSWR